MNLTMMTAIGGFLALLVAAVIISWLAFVLGRWLGVREARREHPEDQGPVGSIVGATLALLAFTLAITFNMAHSKHNGRKELVREDAKAIRAAYDRALLLPPEAAEVAHEKLAEYARIRAFDTFVDPGTSLPAIVARSEQIQRELWLQALAHREHPQVRFYMDSLSALTNTHAERVTMGVHDHVPIAVWVCLIVVTALGMLTLGYPMIRLAEALASLPAGLQKLTEPRRARSSHAWSDSSEERADRYPRPRRDSGSRSRPR
jgi:hypothetical protein